MAPKQPEMTPAISSTEEEEESGEDESPRAQEKPESDSEEESETVPDSPKTKQPEATVTKPESSAAKRPLKQSEDESKHKKVKTSTTEQEDVKKKISGEEARKMFQRLFSESDEIALLKGYIDFSSTKGDPSEKMDSFCEYVKTLIDFNANRSQILTKIQRLKKKFVNMVKKATKKGKDEDEIEFGKDLDQKIFDLSRKIWGSDGVIAAKSKKKVKEDKPKANVVNIGITTTNKLSSFTSHGSRSREMAEFFKAENESALGLDVSTVTASWDTVADGPEKREMEEGLKRIRGNKVELCLLRNAIFDKTMKKIFEDYASTS